MTLTIFWVFILILALQFAFTSAIFPYHGIFDKKICSNKSEHSFSHQIHTESLPDCCLVETIEPSDCHFVPKSVFVPFESPFNLHIYQYKEDIYNFASINISFPNLKWRTMLVLFTNLDEPDTQLCRKFHFTVDTPMNASVFWDCLIFPVSLFENNNFTLRLEDELHNGGSYLMRMPLIKNIDFFETSLKDWHIFFYIHKHYFESTGNLVVTFLKAPFHNITYKLLTLQCMDQFCSQHSLVHSKSLSYELSEESNMFITTTMESWLFPGSYILAVQIDSPECDPECPLSFSPVYEITEVKPLAILGILALVFVTMIILCILLICTLRFKYANYVRKRSTHGAKVLLIYHPHSLSVLKFLDLFSSFLNEFGLLTLMVDNESQSKDPNTWIKAQLCNADKVLFVVPSHLEQTSVTSVKNQWKFATQCFSMDFFQNGQDVAKFATLKLPSSMPLNPDDDIFFLKKFSLPQDSTILIKWIQHASAFEHFFFISPSSKAFTDLFHHKLQEIMQASTNDKSESLPPKVPESFDFSVIPLANSLTPMDSCSDVSQRSCREIFPHLPGFSDLYCPDAGSSSDIENRPTSDTDSDTEVSSDSFENLLFN